MFFNKTLTNSITYVCLLKSCKHKSYWCFKLCYFAGLFLFIFLLIWDNLYQHGSKHKTTMAILIIVRDLLPLCIGQWQDTDAKNTDFGYYLTIHARMQNMGHWRGCSFHIKVKIVAAIVNKINLLKTISCFIETNKNI